MRCIFVNRHTLRTCNYVIQFLSNILQIATYFVVEKKTQTFILLSNNCKINFCKLTIVK